MDSGDEDELTTGSRDFHKMQEKLFKAGYVEGATVAEEKAQETFYPHQTSLIRVYTDLGKLIGVVGAAISISPEMEDVLYPFLGKLEAYALHLHHCSNPSQLDQLCSTSTGVEEVRSFVQEFKTLHPEPAALVDSLFNDRDVEEDNFKTSHNHSSADCGDSSCKCINGISVDLKKLNF